MSIEKVTAFITRDRDNIKEILVLRHPYAGVQFPSGTKESNETLEEALKREVFEETGLDGIKIQKYIGAIESKSQQNEYLITKNCKAYSRPDSSSFDWVDFRKGITVISQRSSSDFTQVTYTEQDQFPHPNYVTYQITGWVLTRNLTRVSIRHFYHVTTNKQAQDEWDILADNHQFRLFWVPLSNILTVVNENQQQWYSCVLNELKYFF